MGSRPTESSEGHSPMHFRIRGKARQRSRHAKGHLIKHAATVVGVLMDEHVRRGHDFAKNGAPYSCMFEAAPMRSDGEDGAVKRLKEANAF